MNTSEEDGDSLFKSALERPMERVEALKITVSDGETVFTKECPKGKKAKVGSAECSLCGHNRGTDYTMEVVFCATIQG